MHEKKTNVILRVIMSYYPEYIFRNPRENVQRLIDSIQQYIEGSIDFEKCSRVSQQVAGTVKPIESLRQILEISPIPLEEEHNGNPTKKTRPWKPEEDKRLLAGILKFGIENWTSISRFVGNARTRSQCSQRWYRGLDPSICKDHWTVADEEKLLQLVRIHGEKSWTHIASKMGNRSDVQCRYRYRQIQKEAATNSGLSTMRYKPEVSAQWAPPPIQYYPVIFVPPPVAPIPFAPILATPIEPEKPVLQPAAIMPVEAEKPEDLPPLRPKFFNERTIPSIQEQIIEAPPPPPPPSILSKYQDHTSPLYQSPVAQPMPMPPPPTQEAFQQQEVLHRIHAPPVSTFNPKLYAVY